MNKARLIIVSILLCFCGIFNACRATSKEHEHVWQEATCESPKKCKICNETEGTALGHEWQDATCLSPRKCIVCGKTQGKKTDHIWGEATCEEREKCIICGLENIHSKPLGHDWIPATIETPSTCSRCGIQSGEPIPLSSFNRGHFSRWEAHPSAEQYIGMMGYIAVTHCPYLYDSSTEPYENEWLSKPWYATIYEKDKQLYRPVGKVEHKMPIKVVDQELTDWEQGTNSYGGFLFVERLDNGEKFYISVTDFVVEPYWDNENAKNIGYSNPCLAVYHQNSDYYPVDRNNKQYKINDSEIVFIYGDNQWGGIDKTTHQIDVLGKNGRGFFNVDDLMIIY